MKQCLKNWLRVKLAFGELQLTRNTTRHLTANLTFPSTSPNLILARDQKNSEAPRKMIKISTGDSQMLLQIKAVAKSDNLWDHKASCKLSSDLSRAISRAKQF